MNLLLLLLIRLDLRHLEPSPPETGRPAWNGLGLVGGVGDDGASLLSGKTCLVELGDSSTISLSEGGVGSCEMTAARLGAGDSYVAASDKALRTSGGGAGN